MDTARDLELIQRLREGDESAFRELVERHHATMVRIARLYVGDTVTAEDVAQEAWIGVLKGLDGFEGRSSLKTWVFRILTNRAKTRAQRDGRHPSLPLDEELNEDTPAVDVDRFHAGDWLDAGQPHSWETLPEKHLLSEETLGVIKAAIDDLPPNQREVIRLRDVEGWPSGEVCEVLDLSEVNQRVLLHRARSKVRRALEDYLAAG